MGFDRNEVFEKSKQFWNSLFQCIVACRMVGIPGKGRIEGAKIDSTPEIYLYFHVTAKTESRDQNKTNISNLCNCGVAITC